MCPKDICCVRKTQTNLVDRDEITYVFTGHSLDEDTGVLVDENVGLIAWSIDTAGGECDKRARLCQVVVNRL